MVVSDSHRLIRAADRTPAGRAATGKFCAVARSVAIDCGQDSRIESAGVSAAAGIGSLESPGGHNTRRPAASTPRRCAQGAS